MYSNCEPSKSDGNECHNSNSTTVPDDFEDGTCLTPVYIELDSELSKWSSESNNDKSSCFQNEIVDDNW